MSSSALTNGQDDLDDDLTSRLNGALTPNSNSSSKPPPPPTIYIIQQQQQQQQQQAQTAVVNNSQTTPVNNLANSAKKRKRLPGEDGEYTPPSHVAKKIKMQTTTTPEPLSSNPQPHFAMTNNVAPAPSSSNSSSNHSPVKKSALPSTTTVDTASTDSEERAIRSSYVTADGKHVCGECGNALATSWGLDAHIKSVHGKKAFRCDFCDKSFGRKDHLVNHTKSMHTGTKECSQCGLVCSGKDGLTKHIADNHPIIPTMFHQCSECGKNYPSENACKIHINQEHTLVSCQECGNICVGTEGLKKHIVKDHNQGSGSSSSKHQQRYKIEVVFKCEFCSGTFSQQSSLDEHIKSFHMDLQCVACGSALVGSQAMLTHIQETHQASKVMFNTGEICYHCEICESTFDKGHLYDEHFLQNHIFCRIGNELVRPDLSTSSTSSISSSNLLSISHSLPDVKPLLHNLQPRPPQPEPSLNIVYQCAHCDSLFTDQGMLTKHMDSTHPETFALPTEPLPPSVLAEFQSDNGLMKREKIEEQVFYQCLICEQLFLEASSLHSHMDEFHNAGQLGRDSERERGSAGGGGGGGGAAGGDGFNALNVVYECEHCKGLFAEKSLLESHIATEHRMVVKGEDKILSSATGNHNDQDLVLEESGFDPKYQLLLLGDEQHANL